jgi:hypothetical protein
MDLIISLLTNNEFPTLAQNIGIAGLTILIPVAVALFSSGDSKEMRELDNHVVLDYVIQAKYLLIYSALAFLPILFWHDSTEYWRLFEIGVWIAGICYLINVLAVSYKWLKGNKFPIRLGFLRSMTDPKDMEESWNSVWQSDKVNEGNENEFFKIFAERIDKLLKENE